MTTPRRRKHTQQAGRITPDAIAAFRAGDAIALARALRLPPWHASPLEAVGACPWPCTTGGAATWADAIELRAQLEAA